MKCSTGVAMMGYPCMVKPYKPLSVIIKDLALLLSILLATVLAFMLFIRTDGKKKKTSHDHLKQYPVPSPSKSAIIVTLDKVNMRMTKAVIRAFASKGYRVFVACSPDTNGLVEEMFGPGRALIHVPFDASNDKEMLRAQHAIQRKLEQENLQLKGLVICSSLAAFSVEKITHYYIHMLQRDQGRIVFKCRVGNVDSVLINGVSISSVQFAIKSSEDKLESDGSNRERTVRQSYDKFISSNLNKMTSTFEHAVEAEFPKPYYNMKVDLAFIKYLHPFGHE